MNRPAASLVLGLLTALLPGTTTASAALSPCPGLTQGVLRTAKEQVALSTLKLEVSPVKDGYRIGEVAKFDALVTRPADEDPAGQGIPMDRPFVTPAADVSIGVGLLFENDVYLPAFGMTDENGKAILKVKMLDYVKPGTVHASFFAWKTVFEANCARVDETAYVPMPDAFSVRKASD